MGEAGGGDGRTARDAPRDAAADRAGEDRDPGGKGLRV